MNTEIEVKFPNVNHDSIRKRLTEIGAVCEQPMRLMRRVVYHNDHMSRKGAFLRVRDEGYRATLTYKQFDRDSIDGAKEHEVIVSNFDAAVAAIDATGLMHDTYQESKRETWKYKQVEIVLDEWPWVDPYIEIEGPHEKSVEEVANLLQFDWNNAVYGGVANIYLLQYPHIGESGINEINHNWPVIKFDYPTPPLLLQQDGPTQAI